MLEYVLGMSISYVYFINFADLLFIYLFRSLEIDFLFIKEFIGI